MIPCKPSRCAHSARIITEYSNCKIFIAGNLPANIIPMLNQYFGSSKWNDDESSAIIRPDCLILPAEEKKYRIFNDENGAQGAVRIARPFPNRYHPDFPKMLCAEHHF